MMVRYQWTKYSYSPADQITEERFLFAKKDPDSFLASVKSELKLALNDAFFAQIGIVALVIGGFLGMLVLNSDGIPFYLAMVFFMVGLCSLMLTFGSLGIYALCRYNHAQVMVFRAGVQDSFEKFSADSEILRYDFGIVRAIQYLREAGAYKPGAEV